MGQQQEASHLLIPGNRVTPSININLRTPRNNSLLYLQPITIISPTRIATRDSRWTVPCLLPSTTMDLPA